jgi:hypothetical protein
MFKKRKSVLFYSATASPRDSRIFLLSEAVKILIKWCPASKRDLGSVPRCASRFRVGAILAYIHRIAYTVMRDVLLFAITKAIEYLGQESWQAVSRTELLTRQIPLRPHPRVPGDSARGLERFVVIAPLMFLHYEYEPSGKGCAGMQTAIRCGRRDDLLPRI